MNVNRKFCFGFVYRWCTVFAFLAAIALALPDQKKSLPWPPPANKILFRALKPRSDRYRVVSSYIAWISPKSVKGLVHGQQSVYLEIRDSELNCILHLIMTPKSLRANDRELVEYPRWSGMLGTMAKKGERRIFGSKRSILFYIYSTETRSNAYSRLVRALR